jgi:tRNA nucleotidyltransferase (CCA-adding enzyme)
MSHSTLSSFSTAAPLSSSSNHHTTTTETTETLTIDDVSYTTMSNIIQDHSKEKNESGRNMAVLTWPVQSPLYIPLTTQEAELFAILKHVMDEYNNNTRKKEKKDLEEEEEEEEEEGTSSSISNIPLLQVRIAGGWVRDKLLGRPTQDVDVAVEHLSGVAFAELVSEHCHNQLQTTTVSTLQQQQQSPSSTQCSRITTIAANPEQSKHLETATMTLCGLDVDVCALRSHEEVYAANSRIPLTTTGTPLQDAQRRDFTINALFYNLSTHCIEDWTQRGLQDLCQQRLVPPLLDAYQTIADDPLRILRGIRFAMRYNFQMDPRLEQVARHADIHRALHVKISRERVGKELDGMLSSSKGANPIAALQTIARLQLAGSVFCLPSTFATYTTALSNGTQQDDGGQNSAIITAVYGQIGTHDYREDVLTEEQARHVRETGWQEAVLYLQQLPTVLEVMDLQTLSSLSNCSVDSRLLPVAAFLLPFRKLSYQQQQGNKKIVRDASAVQYIMREGLKFKNKDVHVMSVLMDHVDAFAELIITSSAADSTTSLCRLQAGLLLRSTKEVWVTCLLLATVLTLRDHTKDKEGKADTTSKPKQQIMASVLALFRTITINLGLDECWKVKPLLDGKALIDVLVIPKGPQVGIFAQEQVRWMLLHPQGTKEELLAHLLMAKKKNALEISTVGTATRDGGHDDNPVGKSDGTKTSPLLSQQSKSMQKHFSKKMHVETADMEE